MASVQRLSLRQVIWIGLSVITAVLLVIVTASIIGRVTVARAVAELGDHMLPDQVKVTELRRSYADQDNGYRAFMLTGDPAALDPYFAGAAVSQRLKSELRDDLAGHTQAIEQLDKVAATAAAWRSQAAEPQIAARRNGPLPPAVRDEVALAGKQMYDEVRAQTQILAEEVDELIRRQLDRIRAAQRLANNIQLAAAGLVLIILIAAVVMVHRLLNRPLATLVDEVRSVADGDYDRVIHRAGPREIAEVSGAVEKMRENLRASTVRIVESERRDEQARIAADLHDRIIQRVFGLGLALTSASARRTDLEPFIDETDEIVRDLREVIFNLHASATPLDRPMRLRGAVIDTVESSVASLGFTPTLHFQGPVDETPFAPEMYAAVLAVVRESLSNTARHSQATAATVCVAVTADELRITLEDNGIGISANDRLGSGRRNIQNRARQFGGRAEIRNADPGPGTVVDWVVPLSIDDRASASRR